MTERIFLYGPPGSGKTSIGAQLSDSLAWRFFDLDSEIEKSEGMKIPRMFSENGEQAFREVESRILKNSCKISRCVISLGGGALLDPENRQLVGRMGMVIFLDASLEELVKRVADSPEKRPLIKGGSKEDLEILLKKRNSHYSSFPNRIKIDGKSIEKIVAEVQDICGVYSISGMGDSYEFNVTRCGIEELGRYLSAGWSGTKLLLVTDSNVARHHLQRVSSVLEQQRLDTDCVVIPAGEETKNMQTIQNLWDSFLDAGLDRSSVVIAMGGGVVGDIVGFASATYMRGIQWVNLPTSLLAMVDACIGGKTGVDLPKGKNLVGAFHPPRYVMADVDFLETLPVEELRNGLAEVIKHGVIADPELFEICRQIGNYDSQDWLDIVKRAAAVKVHVINDDPYERSSRALLNLGHTLGHAIEIVSDFSVKHGEAVSIGIVAAARLSENLGVAIADLSETIQDVLKVHDLPVHIPEHLDRELVITAIKSDKKRKAGKDLLVLPVRIGEVKWGIPVSDIRKLVYGVGL
jgi:3-dehydroquinate synthase